jgi:hypothetical protein
VRRVDQILDWIFEKHFTELMVIAALAGAAILVLLAFPAHANEASGWWQVAIGIWGLPLVIHELYRLRKTLEEKPEIYLRIAPGKQTELQISTKEVLPEKTINLSRGQIRGDFSLVVGNAGSVPAKSVVIRIQHKPPASDPTPPSVRPEPFEPFKHEVDRIYTCRLDDKFKIYPGVPQVFHFQIGHPGSSGFFLNLKDVPPGEHLLDCTVWFEGMKGEPITVDEKLLIKIVD